MNDMQLRLGYKDYFPLLTKNLQFIYYPVVLAFHPVIQPMQIFLNKFQTPPT